MYRITKVISLFAFILTSSQGFSGDFPQRPVPPKLVNDYTGFLGISEAEQLEQKLVDFDRETTTQIAVVILDDLKGYAISDYAVKLGRDWGIGQQGSNNGILILIKPKTPTASGEVFIAPGYGLEGAVPDAIAKRIVENEILPSFKAGNYYEGVDKAVNTLISLTRGEFTADEYHQRTNKPDPGTIVYLIFIATIIVFSIIGRARRARQYSVGHNMPFWLAMMMMSGSRGSHGGSFGKFSSGSGSFGGGGGFGGFGGGSFGGGGAGGRW